MMRPVEKRALVSRAGEFAGCDWREPRVCVGCVCGLFSVYSSVRARARMCVSVCVNPCRSARVFFFPSFRIEHLVNCRAYFKFCERFFTEGQSLLVLDGPSQF